jgi:protein-S-isoprenylcysteine O-methyltransferase Ste14
MTAAADSPGVIARPPLLYLGTLILALIAHTLRPIPIAAATWTRWAGIPLIVLGFALANWGRRIMRAAGTNIDPAQPATAIVTTGPFGFSRNPLYLSLTIVYLGLTLAFNTLWGLALLVPLLILMHTGVVLREERYLDQKFGQIYRQYRARVRRYL